MLPPAGDQGDYIHAGRERLRKYTRNLLCGLLAHELLTRQNANRHPSPAGDQVPELRIEFAGR